MDAFVGWLTPKLLELLTILISVAALFVSYHAFQTARRAHLYAARISLYTDISTALDQFGQAAGELTLLPNVQPLSTSEFHQNALYRDIQTKYFALQRHLATMAVLMPSALLPRQMRLTELAWLMADHFHQGRFDQLEAAFGKLHREALQLRNDFRKVIGVVD